MEDAAERRTKSDHFRKKAPLLPVERDLDAKVGNGHVVHHGGRERKFSFPGSAFKKDEVSQEQKEKNFSTSWLPPGTKQESTWEPGDRLKSGEP